jgi:hypothetical protein
VAEEGDVDVINGLEIGAMAEWDLWQLATVARERAARARGRTGSREASDECIAICETVLAEMGRRGITRLRSHEPMELSGKPPDWLPTGNYICIVEKYEKSGLASSSMGELLRVEFRPIEGR